ncbi:MAG: hypothetical protein OXH81_26405 [Gemmatimonadetes bacterium]|nr:hypothetical protein [Gemmatimonadota bacterium]
MFLARKISLAKWSKKSELEVGEIPADAVTADLRTQDNKLSFWRCGDAEEIEINEAVLALSAVGTRVDKIDVVWLAADDLQNDGQTLQDTKERTPVLELAELHVDVCRLDYIRLGKVAQHIFTAIQKDQYLRLGKARVKQLLAEAVEQERIDPNDLQQRVCEELGL